MVIIGQYGAISLWGTYIYIPGSSRYVNVCLFLRKMQKLYISGRSRYIVIHVYKFKASMQLLNYLPTETESCLTSKKRRLPHVDTFQCFPSLRISDWTLQSKGPWTFVTQGFSSFWGAAQVLPRGIEKAWSVPSVPNMHLLHFSIWSLWPWSILFKDLILVGGGFNSSEK